MKESDLFPYLQDYFQSNPCNEIFTEVVGLKGGRPDMVIRNQDVITIIEIKTSLSMSLIEQAMNWRYKADYVYIAIPKPIYEINSSSFKILRDNGIGILVINVPTVRKMKYKFYVTQLLKPIEFENPIRRSSWNECLKDIYRCENNVKGGNSGGGYNTPYKAMILNVKRYIYENSNAPICIKELVKNVPSVKAHYSNPKASLYRALTKIESANFEVEICNRKAYFSLKENAYESFNMYN